jgi:hypothetical protein
MTARDHATLLAMTRPGPMPRLAMTRLAMTRLAMTRLAMTRLAMTRLVPAGQLR